MIIPKPFNIIVAADLSNGIGKSNALPWHIKSEMAYFKKITTSAPPGKFNVVIMGRKTYESLPDGFRPLPNRMNIVISANYNYVAEHTTVVRSLQAALARCASDLTVHQLFVIGGGQVYDVAIDHHKLERIYLTRIITTAACDTHFPKIPAQFKLSQHSGIIDTPEKIQIQYEVWRKP
jgi:dihydrofolate reductase